MRCLNHSDVLSLCVCIYSFEGFVTCQEQFEYSDECIKVSFMIEADIMYKTVSECAALCRGCALKKIL